MTQVLPTAQQSNTIVVVLAVMVIVQQIIEIRRTGPGAYDKERCWLVGKVWCERYSYAYSCENDAAKLGNRYQVDMPG